MFMCPFYYWRVSDWLIYFISWNKKKTLIYNIRTRNYFEVFSSTFPTTFHTVPDIVTVLSFIIRIIVIFRYYLLISDYTVCRFENEILMCDAPPPEFGPKWKTTYSQSYRKSLVTDIFQLGRALLYVVNRIPWRKSPTYCVIYRAQTDVINVNEQKNNSKQKKILSKWQHQRATQTNKKWLSTAHTKFVFNLIKVWVESDWINRTMFANNCERTWFMRRGCCYCVWARAQRNQKLHHMNICNVPCQ